MEKILIIGCKRAMNEVCIGCSRCLVAFNRREGMFKDYPEDAQILGLLSCGDCPGATIVTRLAQVKLWNAPMNEIPTKIHIGPCIADHCPYADDIITKIKVKAGIEVIEGTHSYMPDKIFAEQK
ncbi:MAG: CGGC domain-containing protein [Desulfonatronovibrio sp.]